MDNNHRNKDMFNKKENCILLIKVYNHKQKNQNIKKWIKKWIKNKLQNLKLFNC